MHIHLLRPLLYLIFIALCVACTIDRYPEGPKASIWPAKDRVTNTWEWAYYLEGESNRSGVYQDSLLVLTADQELKICDHSDNCREGTWQLISKKKKLQLIFGQEARAFDILLLKQGEMWLEFSETDSSKRVLWELVTKTE